MNNDPTNFKEAMMSPENDDWKKAIQEELSSIEENQVWKLVDKPKAMSDGSKLNLIDSRWIFKRKIEKEGTKKFKARLVIRGFKDKSHYELRETYAPVSRISLIRIVLAIVNKYNLEVRQLDVKTAFLNRKLDEEIYLEIPEGLEYEKEIKKTKVFKLEKAMYGLKISSNRWNKLFYEELKKLGLENDINEPCLFTWRKDGRVLILIFYVDDILLASNDNNKLEEVKQSLSKNFKMKDLGEPKNYLGMTIERFRDKKIMKIHQSDYIEKVLEKFKMQDCKPQNTPMVTRQVRNRENQIRTEKLKDEMIRGIKNIPYREAIGSLLYLA